MTSGGPSEGRLLPEDQIMAVNGECVRNSPRERVIELVRNSGNEVTLTVSQPHILDVRSYFTFHSFFIPLITSFASKKYFYLLIQICTIARLVLVPSGKVLMNKYLYWLLQTWTERKPIPKNIVFPLTLAIFPFRFWSSPLKRYYVAAILTTSIKVIRAAATKLFIEPYKIL